MCGRYGVPMDGRELAAALDAEWRCEPLPQPLYNVAPAQHAPVLLGQDGGRELDMLRWGLIPFWAKEPSIGNKLINARAETVAEKPAFRDAFRRRRCLVPAGGFYEWRKTPAGKVPHWIHPADGSLLTLAGLWEEWRPSGAEPVRTFAILTVAANAFMRPLHERMPVVVAPEDRDPWLDPAATTTDLTGLLRPAPENLLGAHPVSARVNSPAHDAPDCIELTAEVH